MEGAHGLLEARLRGPESREVESETQDEKEDGDDDEEEEEENEGIGRGDEWRERLAGKRREDDKLEDAEPDPAPGPQHLGQGPSPS